MEHDFPADEDQDSTPRAFAVTAPRRPGGREQPAEMFDSAGVPEDLADTCIEVRFEPRTMYTISFADELIPETLVRRRCRHLTLRGISRRLSEVARQSAIDHDVVERLTIETGL